MKKIFVIIILSLIFVLTSCKDNSMYLKSVQQVSEIEYCHFEFINDDYYLSLVGGQREEPYIIDGVAQNLIDYGVIKFKPFSNEKIEDNITAIVCVSLTDYTVNLQQNPFDFSYMADIKFCPKIEDIVFVKIKYLNVEFEEQLIEITSNFKLNANDSLKYFVNNYGDIIKNFEVYDKLNIEFHISILQDEFNKNTEYFWYVAFFDGKNMYSACFDVYDGKIKANNFNIY